MLHFRDEHRTKYALEAFTLIAQVEALLPPKQAYELLWNRTCNSQGGLGRNVPLDLHNEHLNRVFKDDLNTFRAQITESSVKRSAQALGPMMKFLENVDSVIEHHPDSGKHTSADKKQDFDIILKMLNDEKIMHNQPKRMHKSFQNFTTDPFHRLDHKKLLQWLAAKRKDYALQQAFDSISA